MGVASIVAVLQDTVTKVLKAPHEWNGQRIVVVTGGSILSSSSSSTAEINFRVLVPPSANFTVHTRRLFDEGPLSSAAHDRHLAAYLDSASYHERVRNWETTTASIAESRLFNYDFLNELAVMGLPIPPGMSIRCKSLGIEM